MCVFQIFINKKYEFPFLVVLTMFVVHSQFQIFLSLTRYNQIFLLLNFLLKDFEFEVLKIQMKNQREFSDFCNISTMFVVLSQF